jgi:hypothetical protein
VSPEGDPLDGGVLTVRSWDEIVRTHRLWRVTTNRFFDQLRGKQGLRFETFADDASERTPSLEPTPSQAFNDQTVDGDVRTALAALSPGARAASCSAISKC